MFSSQIKIISTTFPFMEQTKDTSSFKKMLVIFSHIFLSNSTRFEKLDI